MTFFDYSENINPVKEFGIRDDEAGKEKLKANVLAKNPCDEIAPIKFKKAYICNKAHPYFNCQYKDRIQRFFKETGVSLRTEKLIKNIR